MTTSNVIRFGFNHTFRGSAAVAAAGAWNAGLGGGLANALLGSIDAGFREEVAQIRRYAHSQQKTSDLQDLSSLIQGARDVIADASGKCADLLGKDALAKFDRISKNIQFEPNLLVTTISPFGDKVTEESWATAPFLQGIADGEDIYLGKHR